MAVGEHKAVAIQPGWVSGIVAEKLLPQAVRHRRQPHGRARMSTIGLLHGVNREGANCVDGQSVQLLSGYQGLFTGYHPMRSFWESLSALEGYCPNLLRVSKRAKGFSKPRVYQFPSKECLLVCEKRKRERKCGKIQRCKDERVPIWRGARYFSNCR